MFDQFQEDLETQRPENRRWELKARGLDSLEAGRNAFQQFNSLIMKRSPSRSQNATPPPREDSSSGKITAIEMPATNQWSKHLESAWDELLENNKHNYELAERAQLLVDNLMERCREQAQYCYNFQEECNHLPDTSKHLTEIGTLVGELKGTLIKLNEDIDEYCKEHEQDEFEAWKKEQDKQLQQYILDKKDIFITKEKQLEQKYDIHVKELTSKRIELYEANFQAEIDEYRHRRENQVSSLYADRPMVDRIRQKLDSVTLDAADTHVLDDFLGDEESSIKSEATPTRPPCRKAKAASSEEDSDEDDAPHNLVQADEDYTSS